MMRRSVIVAFVVLFQALAAQAETRFEVSYDKAAHAGPLTGRVLLMISRTQTPEPRMQAAPNAIPMFGVDAEGLAAGRPIVIDQTTFGHPFESLSKLPAGEYYVQAMINVYTECKRSDGKTVWVHWDMNGQAFNRSAGNLYSEVQKVTVDPAAGYKVSLVMNKVMPAPREPTETKWIKRIRIKSESLSKFWGIPIHLRATVILPKGYDENPNVRYPVVYAQGQLGSPPYYFTENPEVSAQERASRAAANVQPGYEFYKEWISDKFPRFLAVSFVEPSPFFPDSYSVNSANNGPFGDAITQELIPAVEKQFRAIGKPYARIVQGASTGGWGTLGLQLKHPDFFGGAWVFNPDPIDFRRWQLVNIYEDENAFYVPGRHWSPIERPFRRTLEGQATWTVKQVSNFEDVLGSKCRGGYQICAWEAIYGPVGADGYPRQLWDKRTGKIDKEVAEYMRKNGYDLRHYAETNWATLGPKLQGKLHFIAGEMDNFYLNLGVYLFEEFTKKTTNPKSDATYAYGRPMQGHSYHAVNFADMIRQMGDQVKRNTPAGESRAWTEY